MKTSPTRVEKSYFLSPIGLLEIGILDNALVSLDFVRKDRSILEHHEHMDSELAKEVKRQLTAYFAGKLFDFDLPIKQQGTPFQQKAWKYLQSIPYGETRSYRDEANGIGSPKAVRAVGNANGKNPIAIIIPCHRVIQRNGTLGGYSGGLHRKPELLALEKRFKR